MRNFTLFFIYCCFLMLLFGCAGTGARLEKPEIGMTSLRVIPYGGMSPRFEIGLHIVNPNSTSIELKGIFYKISIENHKILAGASNKLPLIEAYGQQDITLQASVDLLGSAILLGDILALPKDEYEYTFDAKLDIAGIFNSVVIREEGKIPLTGLR